MRAHTLLLTTFALMLLAPLGAAQDTTMEPAAPDDEAGAGGDGGDVNVDVTENEGAPDESLGDAGGSDGWSVTTVLVVVVVAVLLLALVVAALSGRNRVDRY